MGDNLICGNSEGCPVSHVVQLDSHLPLVPIHADLFLPELGVARTESQHSSSIVVALYVPVAVGDTCRRVDSGDSTNWQLLCLISREYVCHAEVAFINVSTGCEASKRG